MAVGKPEVLFLRSGLTILPKSKSYTCIFGVSQLSKGTADVVRLQKIPEILVTVVKPEAVMVIRVELCPFNLLSPECGDVRFSGYIERRRKVDYPHSQCQLT
jgi:hypothetical protein